MPTTLSTPNYTVKNFEKTTPLSGQTTNFAYDIAGKFTEPTKNLMNKIEAAQKSAIEDISNPIKLIDYTLYLGQYSALRQAQSNVAKKLLDLTSGIIRNI
ncbi:EscF/YscF/HrpA family type III secretion system needle major subunit [Yersinia nurmii]|uniref:EscF/YscF/HrpA family type III secretion system needle major subunit n=1 Tax=Yersinia nurmii TaxID=685706 RepID=A0AAW7K2Q7_9GAMM|nr:EscF/YscF/HrpA family type III secretion system needle major subunit [Yersinia nurmii]MDN0088878.1 EscF/YscF/HrpA family type III secretion system needle major subunit [Yersinia nurmii]CNF07781.1 type III secretion apparatus needle protein [Yersinia nurmii]